MNFSNSGLNFISGICIPPVSILEELNIMSIFRVQVSFLQIKKGIFIPFA